MQSTRFCERRGGAACFAHSKGVIVSICKNPKLYWRVVNTFLIKLSHCCVEEEQTHWQTTQGSYEAPRAAPSEQTPLIVCSNCFGYEWSLEEWGMRRASRGNSTCSQLTSISCLNETPLRKSNTAGMKKSKPDAVGYISGIQTAQDSLSFSDTPVRYAIKLWTNG